MFDRLEPVRGICSKRRATTLLTRQRNNPIGQQNPPLLELPLGLSYGLCIICGRCPYQQARSIIVETPVAGGIEYVVVSKVREEKRQRGENLIPKQI